MLCLTFLHFHLDSYIVNKGEKRRRGELNEKFRKMHLKFASLHPHVQAELAFVQGELSSCFQCGVCALLGL
jgi:heterodisulfide reductase subunit C